MAYCNLCRTGKLRDRVPAKLVPSLLPNLASVFVGFMALILLPDDCSHVIEPPGKKRRRQGPDPEAGRVAKSDSAASLSSRSSHASRESIRSAASSSKCSFAPLRSSDEDPSKKVRIAIGGAW